MKRYFLNYIKNLCFVNIIQPLVSGERRKRSNQIPNKNTVKRAREKLFYG